MFIFPENYRVNGEGKKLVNHDLVKIPLSQFNTCPRRHLPDVKGRLIQDKGNHRYVFQIGGPNDLVSIVEGSHEDTRMVGDVEWLQYNGWNRADHHRGWSVKFMMYQDDKCMPIDMVPNTLSA